jgi:hypothetical protein
MRNTQPIVRRISRKMPPKQLDGREKAQAQRHLSPPRSAVHQMLAPTTNHNSAIRRVVGFMG